MKGKMFTIVAAIGLIGAGMALLWPSSKGAEGRRAAPQLVPAAVPQAERSPSMRVDRLEIPPESTFSRLMEDASVPAAHVADMLEAARDVFDLATIRAGRTIDLIRDPANGDLLELVYAPNTEEELHLALGGGGWKARLEPIAYDIKLKTAEGAIERSLYEAALAQGIDERAVIEFADVFQWTVDFSQDVRKGDSFKFIYEERYRDGAYKMPGRILAAKYVNDGKEHRAYHFKNAGGEEGYYDEKGAALRRMFLMAPVAFKYVTSGFTTGRRYVAAFNTSTGHRAIDYAAKTGTPVRATADGTVAQAGWNGPYGNFVSIRHNGTYTTNYAHQSKIAVKRGQKVKQGQVIGYVGSTGFSTGPHLHYEMVKNGTKINPRRETFPGTDPIKPEERPSFEETAVKWKDLL